MLDSISNNKAFELLLQAVESANRAEASGRSTDFARDAAESRPEFSFFNLVGRNGLEFDDKEGDLVRNFLHNRLDENQRPIGRIYASTVYGIEARRNKRVALVPCSTDMIAAVEDFLWTQADFSGMDDVNHFIQRRIREEFNLDYSEQNKLALKLMCDTYNELFFSETFPEYRTVPECSYVTVENALSRLDTAIPAELGEPANLARAFLNFALFFRLVRPMYAKRAQAQIVPVVECKRLADYNYLLAKVFGTSSAVPNLTFLYRGGLLPRVSNGRTTLVYGSYGSGKTTFALQQMVGMARRGGLSIYLPLEESKDLVADRILAFSLAERDSFLICQVEEDEVPKVVLAHRQSSKTQKMGLLILVHQTRPDLPDTRGFLNKVCEACREQVTGVGEWLWRGIVIDSVNALGNELIPSSLDERCRELALAMESHKFYGIALFGGDASISTIPYYFDTSIKIGREEEGLKRWIEIEKCRIQPFHLGTHPMRLTARKGIVIFPSFSSVQSTLAKRMSSVPSATRQIVTDELTVPEKSIVAIRGERGVGKSSIGFQLALANTVDRTRSGLTFSPKSVLMVTFSVSEGVYLSRARKDKSLQARLGKLRASNATVRIKRFGPGDANSLSEIFWKIWEELKRGIRIGKPVDRLVFDDIEAFHSGWKGDEQLSEFWTTLLMLVRTEASGPTTILVGSGEGSDCLADISPSVDYVVDLNTSVSGYRLHQAHSIQL